MGRGPLHFGEHGVSDRLRARRPRGHPSRLIDVPDDVPDRGRDIVRALSSACPSGCGAVVAGGRFPLVLAGNCGSSLGTVSGVRAATPNDSSDIGVIWLDAHADFNTPDTTTSGFLDGTVLAALTGRGWQRAHRVHSGLPPVSDAHVVLVGARDIDAGEERLLASSRVMRVEAARMQADGARAALDPALTELARHVSRVYLHIDLDVHDPARRRRISTRCQAGWRRVRFAISLGSWRTILDRGRGADGVRSDVRRPNARVGLQLMEDSDQLEAA